MLFPNKRKTSILGCDICITFLSEGGPLFFCDWPDVLTSHGILLHEVLCCVRLFYSAHVSSEHHKQRKQDFFPLNKRKFAAINKWYDFIHDIDCDVNVLCVVLFSIRTYFPFNLGGANESNMDRRRGHQWTKR